MAVVSIVKCADYEEEKVLSALKQTFDQLGGIQKYVKPGANVALKVNLLMAKRPEEVTTTHPSIVKSLIRLIQDAGGRPLIIDSPGGPYTQKDLQRIYETSGMELVAQETGAELNYDLSVVEIAHPDGKLLKRLTVLKPLVDADVVINMPKLKTHGMMVFTGAVKNLFGAIPGLTKAEFHMRMPKYEDFADALIDIFLSVKPTLNIMDAVVGMEGDGPSAGKPKTVGIILAAEDGFALDRIALKLINADPMEIPIIRQAVARGICPPDGQDIEIVGERVEEIPPVKFDIPQLNGKGVGIIDNPKMADRFKPRPVFNHAVCIGCADCAKNCPARVIKMVSKRPEVDLSQCIRCFCCQELCPVKAVEIRRSKFWGFVFDTACTIFYRRQQSAADKKGKQ